MPELLSAAEDWRAGGFGVYVHWPFCAAKCPYCDFNSHVRGAVDAARWRQALVAELEAAARTVPGRTVDTIFFGGGTPSLMPPETVAGVIDAVRSSWPLAPGAEITLEANPTSVEAGRFRGYRDAGVNRLSMGIQALNDADLRGLGRRHDTTEAVLAFEVARSIFPRVSFDLIYARQGQALADWTAELRRAIAMAPEHLSLYQLTIEAGTRFGDLAARGLLRGLPDSDTASEMYLATAEICAAAGLEGYEVSNYAGRGAESRHNLVYWRYGDYVGVGPGAHGRLTYADLRWAIESLRSPEAWLDAVEQRGSGIALQSPVSRPEQGVEMLMMGLRLLEGVDPARFAALSGAPLAPERIGELCDLGLLSSDPDRLRTTGVGRPLLDALLKCLLAA